MAAYEPKWTSDGQGRSLIVHLQTASARSVTTLRRYCKTDKIVILPGENPAKAMIGYPPPRIDSNQGYCYGWTGLRGLNLVLSRESAVHRILGETESACAQFATFAAQGIVRSGRARCFACADGRR